MATIEIKVPDIGDYNDVPVIEILVAVGDTVAKDQGLVTLESDKATLEVPSSAAGVVKAVKVKLGDTLSQGDVVVLLEDQAAERQVSFVLDNDPAELRVKANRYKLKQLLINLVDNAIKYNREGGQIFIDAARRPDGLVELRVRDTGPGIDREHQDRIFERFYRIDRSRSRELGGTGLGLSIVKHIAMLYRGQATVESEPGEGSTFRITLDV